MPDLDVHPARPAHATRHLLRSAGAALALGAALLAGAPAQAADVGVSIGIQQPGVYGRIDIGRFPQPQVVYAQPILVAPQAYRPQPVYLHVPPGHRANWRQHCRAYGACGMPVYFVQERWYQDTVVRGEPRHGHRWDERAHHQRGEGRWDDRHDDRRWDDRHGGRRWDDRQDGRHGGHR